MQRARPHTNERKQHALVARFEEEESQEASSGVTESEVIKLLCVYEGMMKKRVGVVVYGFPVVTETDAS